ncbi:hypothetical protein L195_g048043, partial [Trifolium pratense]
RTGLIFCIGIMMISFSLMHIHMPLVTLNLVPKEDYFFRLPSSGLVYFKVRIMVSGDEILNNERASATLPHPEMRGYHFGYTTASTIQNYHRSPGMDAQPINWGQLPPLLFYKYLV